MPYPSPRTEKSSLRFFGTKPASFGTLVTGQVLETLSGHTSGVNAVSITPDGIRAISGSMNKYLHSLGHKDWKEQLQNLQRASWHPQYCKLHHGWHNLCHIHHP